MTGRQQQAKETKKRIFEAAMDQMRQKGFYGTRIEDVCRTAKVSVGTFYHHFDSKLDIFSFTYAQADAYFETEVAEQLQTEAPPRKILVYFGLYADFNKQMGIDFVKVLYHVDNTWFTRNHRAMQRVLQDQIVKAQTANVVDPKLDPEVLGQDLFIVARGAVYDWCVHNGTTDLSEAIARLVGRMLKGCEPPSSYR
jgi:TetR/AcrR family transcriptional regulator, fatty acid metabolism regulator protein